MWYLRPLFPYWFFCWDDLSINGSWLLNSPAVIVLLSVSPYMSVNISFIYLGAPIVGTYMFTRCYVLFLDWPLYYYVIPFFASFYSLCFKLCFIVWCEYCYPIFSFHFYLHDTSFSISLILFCVFQSEVSLF